jgi:RNA polymerase sigma factor (sigma-70 family)
MERKQTAGQPAEVWVREAHARYAAPLAHYAVRLLSGDQERAQDAVQETFARLCREESADARTHLAEWLFTVCRHITIDIRRKEQRMSPLSDALAEKQTSHAPSPPQAAEKAETLSEVLRAMAGLSDSQQECLRLKFQHGFSYDEIARVTGLSISNVGVQIHLGLKRVREQLGVVVATVPAREA